MTRRVTLIVIVVVALALPSAVVGFFQYQAATQRDTLGSQARELRHQAAELCTFQHRSWDIQHEQILADAIPRKPDEAILRAFPQFRPFYDPHNALYAEQIRSLDLTRDRRLRVLGPPPDC